MKKSSVVFIGPHPDDIVQAAGTLLLLKERYKIHNVCLTRGQRGYTRCPDSESHDPSEEIVAIRHAEELAVCRILNAEMTFFDEMDGELFAGREICERVATELKLIRPVAVFALWPLQKPDHSAASEIARRALHLADLFWTTELYLPLFNGEDFHAPAPDLYVNISSVIAQKEAILRCYPSQFGEESIQSILQQGRSYGKQAWCEHAEPFFCGLPLVGSRWNRKAGSILLDLAHV